MMNASNKTFTTKITNGGHIFKIGRGYASNGSKLEVVRNFLSEEMSVTEADYDAYEVGFIENTPQFVRIQFVRDVGVFTAGEHYDIMALNSDPNTILLLQDK